MPKLATEMGALAVSRVTTPGLHFVGYVTGLALQVKGSGAKSWILRSVIGGKRRDMGLGAYPARHRPPYQCSESRMKSRSMLSHIKLEAFSDVSSLDRITKANAMVEAHDQAVLDYIKIRGSNQDFRYKLNEILKIFKGRRGPKPEGLPPIAFFELINAIKKSYKLKSIMAALEIYCDLHGLPIDKASSLEDKYRRGREERAKKGGN